MWKSACVTAVVLLCGCDVVESLWEVVGPNTVRVVLVNTTESDVDPQMFVNEEEDLLEFLLDNDLNRFAEGVILEPGDVEVFTFDCDDIGIVGSVDAELLFAPLISPDSSNDPILRQGEDFECGDEVRFDFTGGLSDFHVSASVEPFGSS